MTGVDIYMTDCWSLKTWNATVCRSGFEDGCAFQPVRCFSDCQVHVWTRIRYLDFTDRPAAGDDCLKKTLTISAGLWLTTTRNPLNHGSWTKGAIGSQESTGSKGRRSSKWVYQPAKQPEDRLARTNRHRYLSVIHFDSDFGKITRKVIAACCHLSLTSSDAELFFRRLPRIIPSV